MALTRAALDSMGCDNPQCTHEDHATLFLHAGCHPRSGLTVEYSRLTGELHITCKQCKKHVATLQVAST